MDEQVVVFSEPLLEFRYGQAVADPRDGLSIFGPFDADMSSHPKNLSYALIGVPSGLQAFRSWIQRLQQPIVPADGLSRDLWPMFPGFEAAFSCSLPMEPTLVIELDERRLLRDARNKDPHRRAAGVVGRYLDSVSRIVRRDDPIDVVICVVPDVVHRNCRPLSRVSDGVGYVPTRAERRRREQGQQDLFNEVDPAIYHFSVDFRRQIKARAMRDNLPIQIIRESTLDITDGWRFGDRRLTPLCDRAWNLMTTLYYKAGGKPWRLSTARPGVCYIGIAYRLDGSNSDIRSACCAAQLFLDTGDGLVFMGEYGPWYSPDRGAFHLSRDAARRLLDGVLKTYQSLEGQPLQEIFLHCRSGLNDEEWAGFGEACPPGVRLIGVRVRQQSWETRLYREGTRPVLRGTFWRVGPRTGYLWASGFKPRLGTYDGSEIPAPLRIDIQYGEADLEQVARDILGLTKLNYNACRLGEAEPVTIGFSDAVGEILVSNPTVSAHSAKFKFYI